MNSSFGYSWADFTGVLCRPLRSMLSPSFMLLYHDNGHIFSLMCYSENQHQVYGKEWGQFSVSILMCDKINRCSLEIKLKELNLFSGVPQGSYRDPTLFSLLFIIVFMSAHTFLLNATF